MTLAQRYSQARAHPSSCQGITHHCLYSLELIIIYIINFMLLLYLTYYNLKSLYSCVYCILKPSILLRLGNYPRYLPLLIIICDHVTSILKYQNGWCLQIGHGVYSDGAMEYLFKSYNYRSSIVGLY